MTAGLKRILFFLFFTSGFCSLLYQVVWLRMAFASFGVITPVLSLLVSVFMMGLAIGSWGAGKWVKSWCHATGKSAVVFYGTAEFLIGMSAFAVPWIFTHGEDWLLPAGELNSTPYLLFSAIIIVLSILPWCVCMGATFPLMMEFVRERDPARTDSFSFLYLANVIGAMCGAIITPLVLVELFGFKATLSLAAMGNFTAAVISLLLGQMRSAPAAAGTIPAESADSAPIPAGGALSPRLNGVILFTTGFSSLALEVAWTRGFTPVLETQVYSFASLLFTYLLATWIGSQWYRRHRAAGRVVGTGRLMGLLALCAFAQIIVDDPRIIFSPVPLLASIVPFCGILGYLTPRLIDEWSRGDANAAGRAYAVNVVGCILGPLFASYVLLPWVGITWTLIILSAPFVPLALVTLREETTKDLWSRGIVGATCALVAVACTLTRSYEEQAAAAGSEVRRDYTATVISFGEGMQKEILVNGVGMTGLSPLTKIMAHLPLAFHEQKPDSALMICFGMGTTYRSLLSWDVQTTAVELVPSVRDAFPYYFADAAETMRNPLGRVVIDDGRRYLKRTDQRYDVITLDPPPPVEAAGSSLLYSEEFHRIVSSRLTDDGILQQWFPGGESTILAAIIRSVTNVFPHVRVFPSNHGGGVHILASNRPLPKPTVAEFLARMPEAAQRDMMEWYEGKLSKEEVVEYLLTREVDPATLVLPNKRVSITDNYPFNEYFAIRRLIRRISPDHNSTREQAGL
jgi:spermidine synthase